MGYPTQKDIRQDKEANIFARCLLMPESFVKKELEKLRGDKKIRTPEEMIKILARKFKVSEMQMTIRLTELKIIT